jgi:predicted glycosyltransferase
MFFLHDGVGLGHLRRVSLLGRILQGPCACLVVSGHRASSWIVSESCGLLHLPSLESLFPKKAAYWGRAPFMELSVREALSMRAVLIEAAAKSFAPDAIFLDYLPLGKHNEFASVLETTPAKAYFLMRGVMDHPDYVRIDLLGGKAEDMLAHRYDRIFVTCDDRICDVAKEYDLRPEISSKLLYSGYIAQPVSEEVQQRVRQERGLKCNDIWVVCSAGGGALGERLIEECERLARLHDDVHFDIVHGPKSSTPWPHILASSIQGRIRMHRESMGLPSLHASADIVICSGGYNSIVEAMQGTANVIAVPVQIRTNDEQYIHTERIRAFYDIETVSQLSDLEAVLQRTISNRKQGTRPPRCPLNMEGAAYIRNVVLKDLMGMSESLGTR